MCTDAITAATPEIAPTDWYARALPLQKVLKVTNGVT